MIHLMTLQGSRRLSVFYCHLKCITGYTEQNEKVSIFFNFQYHSCVRLRVSTQARSYHRASCNGTNCFPAWQIGIRVGVWQCDLTV